MSDKINQDFIAWKNHPLTKSLFVELQYQRDKAKEEMSDGEVIVSPNCQIMLIRLLGRIEAFDAVLQMTAESLIDDVVLEEL